MLVTPRAFPVLSILFFAACSATPETQVQPLGRASERVSNARTLEERRAAVQEVIRLSQEALAKLESASAVAGGDVAALDTALQSFDGAFAPLSVVTEAGTQDPDKQNRTPLQRMFADMRVKELAASFPDVPVDTFREAFAQDQVRAETIKEKQNSLEGFNFGTGIGATMDMHRGSRVKSASIRDGVVRVDEGGDAQLGLVLETHYFFGASKPRLWGMGPFVAIKTGENDLIDEAGIGWMLGLRRTIEDTNSFNIGLGVMLDPDAEVLADGFTKNQAPPVGATDVTMKKEERFSFALIFSYTF